jgi:hypothetical protein
LQSGILELTTVVVIYWTIVDFRDNVHPVAEIMVKEKEIPSAGFIIILTAILLQEKCSLVIS